MLTNCSSSVFNTVIVKVKVKSLSRVWIFVTLWTVGHQVPPSVGFPRQEYWSGLPFPSPGDLPDPGIEPKSSALRADTLTSEPSGKPNMVIIQDNYNNFTRVMVTKCVSLFLEAAQWMFNTIIVIVSIPYSQKPSLFINISSLTWGKKHPDNFSMLVPRSLALSSRNSGENCWCWVLAEFPGFLYLIWMACWSWTLMWYKSCF